MPLDPFYATKLAPLEGLTMQDIFTDSALYPTVLAAMSDDRPYTPPQVDVREERIGADALRLRIYTPRSPSPKARAALVWSHGGGFSQGDLDQHEADTVSREIAVGADAVVVSVDYDLANGTTVHYPMLHTQVIEALRWTHAAATELGIDPESITLGGASAGGNLSLAAALDLRDHHGKLPGRLLLAYPAVSIKSETNPEHEARMAGLPPLARFPQETLDLIFSAYTADQTDARYLSSDDVPLQGLPPTLVILSEYDDLRVTAETFIARARQEGVDVSVYLAEGVTHGHLNTTPHLAGTRATLSEMANYLKLSRSGA